MSEISDEQAKAQMIANAKREADTIHQGTRTDLMD